MIGLFAAMVILAFTFGTLVAMGMPIVSAVLRAARRALADRPARPRHRGALDRADAGDDDRPRRRDRLRALPGQPLPVRARRGAGRPTRRSRPRSRPPGPAIVFAGSTVVIALVTLLVAGIPLVTLARLRVGVRGRHRGARGDHAAAGAARRWSAAHRLARAAGLPAPEAQAAGQGLLGRWGRVRHPPSVALRSRSRWRSCCR